MVMAAPMANLGWRIGLNQPAMRLPKLLGRSFSLLHGGSKRIRVMSSGAGSTSATVSMKATAAAESRASSAQAGHAAKWRSSLAF
jgi:hypothetical protein